MSPEIWTTSNKQLKFHSSYTKLAYYHVKCPYPKIGGGGGGGDLTFTPLFLHDKFPRPRGGAQFQRQMQSKSPPIPEGGIVGHAIDSSGRFKGCV